MKSGKEKNMGQVMTPTPLVRLILDAAGYEGGAVLEGTVMEPSFGNGSFLIEIADRIASECGKRGMTPEETADVLKKRMFGIEKDEILYEEAAARLNLFLASKGIPETDWSGNLICGDALSEYGRFEGRMDFVVGNPPYVRVHAVGEDYRKKLKKFEFAGGTTDLYVVFYEIGIAMLNGTGRLGYVTPNSFLKNASQRKFRKFLTDEGCLSALFDFRSSRVFPDAGTYACVCVLDRNPENRKKPVEYREYSMYEIARRENLDRSLFEETPDGEPWILGDKDDARFLSENRRRKRKLSEIASIRNGISTNSDKTYVIRAYEDREMRIPYEGIPNPEDVGKVFFMNRNGSVAEIERGILRRCVKASRFDGRMTNSYMIFPYRRKDGKSAVPYGEKELGERFPAALRYLLSEKERLEGRDMEKGTDWFLFARSQGLADADRRKIAFKRIVSRENPEIRPFLLNPDVIVYSGLYAACDGDPTEVMKTLSSDDFIRWCVLTGKDMANGYVAAQGEAMKRYGLPENRSDAEEENENCGRKAE